MPRLFFEDFTPGWTETFGPVTVTKESIVAFAGEFDPQPFHTDEAAAKRTFVGTLIASGWHTCSLTMRLLADGFLLDTAAQGAPGIEEVKWLRPVLPDDALRARIAVAEARVSKNRPEIGLVRFQTQVLNGRGEPVMTQANWIMIARSGAPWLPAPGTGPDPSAAIVPLAPPTREEDLARPSPYLEDLEIGSTIELGSVTFTPDAIVRFARAYDPQVFHLDPEAARNSLFGGLCASGWHTGSAWMRLMVDHRRRSHAAALARGQEPAALGPSPGFRNLRWAKPVFAGDTVAYRTTLTDARPSATRPGWGIASHRNGGVNQHGEEVFSFEGAVLWQRRP
ncbi:MAG TPA: MaoC family dehydratase [Microvirga sp.]|jgi:acyl dehydratase|nr:MaoC family dehydratase [Microvirga sp.]